KSRTLLTTHSTGMTPQSVPAIVFSCNGGRWAPPGITAATQTPLSQPSSVQSTPSEMHSLVGVSSDRCVNGRFKKMKHSSRSSKSIHYKDTEIIDLFKGVK